MCEKLRRLPGVASQRKSSTQEISHPRMTQNPENRITNIYAALDTNTVITTASNTNTDIAYDDFLPKV